jgi:hypothetical protein
MNAEQAMIDLCRSILLAPYQNVRHVHRRCWCCGGEGRVYYGRDPERDVGEICRVCVGKCTIVEEVNE